VFCESFFLVCHRVGQRGQPEYARIGHFLPIIPEFYDSSTALPQNFLLRSMWTPQWLASWALRRFDWAIDSTHSRSFQHSCASQTLVRREDRPSSIAWIALVRTPCGERKRVLPGVRVGSFSPDSVVESISTAALTLQSVQFAWIIPPPGRRCCTPEP
jgi:hypothetical protein